MKTTQDKNRIFIAVPIDENTRLFLNKYKARIKKLPWSDNIRWVADKNYHITLRFIEQTSEQQLTELNKQLASLPGNTSAFNITILQPQIFPSLSRPKAIAAPIKNNHHLQQLVNTIETAVTTAGLPSEKRPFRGHITIGRIRNSVHGEDLLTDKPEITEMNISAAGIYKSTLRPEGPQYDKLYEFKLM